MKKTTWMAAGFLAFLGLDLYLFGNCVIPPPDSSPRTVAPGKVLIGAQGLAPLIIPALPTVALRYGLNDRTDIGFAASGESIGGSNAFAETDPELGDRYREGEAIALGLDVKRAILAAEGKRLFTLQGGLMHHSAPWDTHGMRQGVSAMGGILLGSDRFHFGVRAHAGMQSVPFYQLEVPLGFSILAFQERLHIELGLTPSVFLASGANSIPWPWQYMGLQWEFGGPR
jgi:hypothetical protein